MSTPTWSAATAGQPPLAAQVNQLLGSHAVQVLYPGTLQASNTANGSAHTSGNGIYMAQQVTTGASQTAIGYITAPIGSYTASGALLGSTTLALYSSSAGAPTGSALASVTLTTEYSDSVTGGTDTVNVTYPLPVTGLTAATTYWLVLAPAGNGTYHYTWRQSTAASGASTSPDGVTWTAQAYGLQYQVYDQAPAGSAPLGTWQDSGARWTATTYTATGEIATYAEYTAGQTAASYLQSYRVAAYSNGILSGVS